MGQLSSKYTQRVKCYKSSNNTINRYPEHGINFLHGPLCSTFYVGAPVMTKCPQTIATIRSGWKMHSGEFLSSASIKDKYHNKILRRDFFQISQNVRYICTEQLTILKLVGTHAIFWYMTVWKTHLLPKSGEYAITSERHLFTLN